MPPRKKRGKRPKKTKYVYDVHLEPVCECLHCGHVHLRRERKKHVPKQPSRFLCIYLCPKCDAEPYLYAGDKEVRRRRNPDDESD